MAITGSNNEAAAAAAGGDNNKQPSNLSRQIPIVCPGHTRPLAELQFCHVAQEDKTLLVSACHDRMPMVRHGTTGDWIGTFSGHKGAVWSCRLDELTCSLAATASGDFSVRVWDAITGTCLKQLPHNHIVKTVDFSPNAKLLATGGHEGILRIFDLVELLQNTNKKTSDDDDKKKKIPAKMEIPQDANTKIIISKCNWLNDDMVVVGCADGAVRFWDITNHSGAQHVVQTNEKKAEVRDMEIRRVPGKDGSGSERTILTVAAGNTVYFYDLTKMTPTTPPVLLHAHTMPVHFRDEGGASLHPDGHLFVAGGSDLWVRVFDVATGKELECCKGHHGPIRCLRFAPDGTCFASGSEDGTIRLWKTNDYNNSAMSATAAAAAAST